jgi:hypothetical protein
MNDNWIKPFQDKLGEFELDLPATAPVRRKTVWLAPLLAGVAAAGLLLFVLLKPSETTPGQMSRLIAEAPATITTPRLDALAPIAPLPARKRQASVPAATTPESASPATLESVTEVKEPETVQTPAPVNDESAPPAVSSESIVEDEVYSWEDFDLPEEEPARRRVRLSGRAHIDPTLLQATRSNYQMPVSSSWYYSAGNRAYLMNAVNDVRYGNSGYNNDISDSYKEKIRHDLPVKTGFSIQFSGQGRFSFETGLNYAFHRSRIACQGDLNNYEMDYRMHYLGLPVKGNLRLVRWERLEWYASLGGELEWMLTGTLYSSLKGQRTSVDPLDRHPLFLSASAATGFEYKFSDHFGIYAEPGVAWHIHSRSDLPDYYRDHPFSFDLHVGVRFDL